MFIKAINVLILIWYLITKAESYSQVKISGSNSTILLANENNEPVIHKAVNIDLIFPKIFNVSESTTNKLTIDEPITSESIGRAVYSSQQYQFPQIISNIRRPPNSRYSKLRDSKSPKYVYPVYRPQPQPSQVEINKLRGKGHAMDRYTPGEAVASALFKKPKHSNNNNGNLRQAASSQIVSRPVYKPIDPKNLYSFPPNHSKYPPPNQVSSTNQISSYVPPAAGPADSTVNEYVGPVSPEYLPANLKNEMSDKDSNKMPDMQPNGEDNEMNSAMESDDMTYPTPPPGYLDNSPSSDNTDDMMMPMPPTSSHDHSPDYTNDHQPDHLHDHDYPTDHLHDHPSDYSSDHHHFPHDHTPHHYSLPWNSFPSFYGSHGVDANPEIIYDDHDHDHDHDHHHHHHHHSTLPPLPLPLPPTTTEEPPEPRVKKYSYFYLGRKLWYIPLYFTVWFSFYVLWLIIKSIARHKVNLPNHYQARHLMKRDIWSNYLTHKEATEEIDQLTISVMNKIDNFKTKYL